MLAALQESDGVKVLAVDVKKGDGPFTCPGCQGFVTLRKGSIKIHHFAHTSDSSCGYGKGESAEHMSAKLEIYEAIRHEHNVSNAEVEKYFDGSRADIYAEISGIPVAIEIQKSNLSIEDISDRTQRYHSLGVAVVWVGLIDSKFMSSIMKHDPRWYSAKSWQKWCHEAFFKRFYFWEFGQTLRPVRFLPSNFTSVQRMALGCRCCLSKDFESRTRSCSTSWTFAGRRSGFSVDIPECTLYVDNETAWREQYEFSDLDAQRRFRNQFVFDMFERRGLDCFQASFSRYPGETGVGYEGIGVNTNNFYFKDLCVNVFLEFASNNNMKTICRLTDFGHLTKAVNLYFSCSNVDSQLLSACAQCVVFDLADSSVRYRHFQSKQIEITTEVHTKDLINLPDVFEDFTRFLLDIFTRAVDLMSELLLHMAGKTFVSLIDVGSNLIEQTPDGDLLLSLRSSRNGTVVKEVNAGMISKSMPAFSVFTESTRLFRLHYLIKQGKVDSVRKCCTLTVISSQDNFIALYAPGKGVVSVDNLICIGWSAKGFFRQFRRHLNPLSVHSSSDYDGSCLIEVGDSVFEVPYRPAHRSRSKKFGGLGFVPVTAAHNSVYNMVDQNDDMCCKLDLDWSEWK